MFQFFEFALNSLIEWSWGALNQENLLLQHVSLQGFLSSSISSIHMKLPKSDCQTVLVASLSPGSSKNPVAKRSSSYGTDEPSALLIAQDLP